MAHEIEFVDGKAQMVYVGDVPWHGLGTAVSNDLTPLEMQKAAGLDWEVIKVPAVAEFGGEFLDTGRSALIRSTDGKVLSVVSNDWNPVQNSVAFDFFTDFVEAGDMEMHTAGSLREGNIVWALAKVGQDFTVFGDDKIEGFLLFSNPHEYGKCVDVRFTPIRVVCNNTLTLSLRGKSDLMVRVNHRNIFDAEMVKRTLGVVETKLGVYKEAAEFLGSRNYNIKTLDKYLKEVFPAHGKKKADKLLSLPATRTKDVIETQPGAEFAKGTWWPVFNAVTYMIDHELGRSVDTRLTSAWYGANRAKKVHAMTKAIEYADAVSR